MTHIGILGAGNISDTHVRAAQALAGVGISAVYSPTLSNAQRLADAAGAAAYDDLARFLAHTPLDLVLIGSPPGLHAEQAITAIERGLHVLIEKPLDVSSARVSAVIAAAAKGRVQVGVFFQDRLKPDIVRVKSLIENQRLGKPVMASGRVKWHRAPDYYGDSRWRGRTALDGGGALMSQGIHTVDLLQWMFGPVVSVTAAIATRIHAIESEDTAAATLTFRSGAIGVIEATTSVYPGYARRLELTGSEGTLIVEGDRLIAEDLREAQRHCAAPDLAPSTPPDAAAVTATVADAEPHARVIADFIEAVRSGRAPMCDAHEGRKSIAIIEAIYHSARTRRAVAVGE
ncbi:MAG TPA: Gfo/Idh/MocA family oxidoreductase [Gemmatimonadaceae bacterium]|nr:Gfo/Idh/MocA family oxidoreductase [Gemmatimonadaceae bacterium]